MSDSNKNIPVVLIAFLNVASFCISGLANASGSWPNEPPGFTAVVDCPFSGTLCPGIWNAYNTSSYMNIPSAPLSPPDVFDVHMDAGSTTGNGQWGVNLDNVKELFIGTWWSTNADFIGNSAANKMLFARNATIDNNFLHWQGEPGRPKRIVWSMQATYDNTGPGEAPCYSCGDGSGFFYPNGSSNGYVAAGSGWHRIEVYIKTSTTKTSRDGILKWWLDGQLVGNYPAVNMTPGGINDFQINTTWDGFNTANRDLTKSWHHYYDHLRLSTGTGKASPDQPAGPPAAPKISGISVQ